MDNFSKKFNIFTKSTKFLSAKYFLKIFLRFFLIDQLLDFKHAFLIIKFFKSQKAFGSWKFIV